MKKREKKLKKIIRRLEKEGKFDLEKECLQHGKTSVYEHSVNVARTSCKIANALRIPVDYPSLMRGALLHDYFLYDWHEKDAGHRLHGFHHPKTALKNAQRDFQLNSTEKNIILHHMFPLTLVPPTTREAWIVCLADKGCAVGETVKPRICSFWRAMTVCLYLVPGTIRRLI